MPPLARFSIAIRTALTDCRPQNCERNAPRICWHTFLTCGNPQWYGKPLKQRGFPPRQADIRYLFRLRATANVKRALERAMAERDWSDAGHGWQGKETTLRLMGWSRQRIVVGFRPQNCGAVSQTFHEARLGVGRYSELVIGFPRR